METNIKITQPDGAIHVFTDASYSEKKKQGGAAWVVATNKPQDELIHHCPTKRVPLLHEEEQNKAVEIFAVLKALQTLPQGSIVHVHSDYHEVLNAIKGLKIDNHARNKILAPLWQELEHAINQHQSVTASYASDTKTHNKEVTRLMRIAHNFAAISSKSVNIKPLLTDKDSQKYSDILAKRPNNEMVEEIPSNNKTPNSHDGMKIIETKSTKTAQPMDTEPNFDDPFGPTFD